jgi:hypothetical protein
LLGGQVPPMDVRRDHTGGGFGIVAKEYFAEARLDAGREAGAIPITAIENLPFEQSNGLKR